MNIKILKLFVHLTESKNFSKTAGAMHISPSALSRQIQKFEDEIGHHLFVRDNRRVELTPAGKKLLPVALQIIEKWQSFQAEIDESHHTLKGEVRLFCSVTASYSHLPDLLSDFRAHHPLIDFQLSTGDPTQTIDKLLKNEADIGISALPNPLPSRIVFKTICDISLSLIAPAGITNFAYSLNSEPPDWSQIPFIVPASGTARESADQWFHEMGIKPKIYAQTTGGHEAIVSMVALGYGVGIAPDVVIINSPVRDKIQRLPQSQLLKPFKLGVCCKRSQLKQPLVNALWQVVTEKKT